VYTFHPSRIDLARELWDRPSVSNDDIARLTRNVLERFAEPAPVVVLDSFAGTAE
jgi:hypothetical protein